ncbi:hypothetical protein Y032_0909g2999 [Ancylostoma ceylanicum]|nr:hypothetical protein Y032_0909g2999 [Ancylostoma ceylanicum]
MERIEELVVHVSEREETKEPAQRALALWLWFRTTATTHCRCNQTTGGSERVGIGVLLPSMLKEPRK